MEQAFRRDGQVFPLTSPPSGVVCVNPPRNAPTSNAFMCVWPLAAGNAVVMRFTRGDLILTAVGRLRRAAAGYRTGMKEPIGDSVYPPEAVDEVTVPQTDPVREAKQRDWGDVADVQVDPEDLRQGGPTKTPGTMTTTGGKAGSGMRHTRGQRGKGKIAPTTTGDATSGGMSAPGGGSTDDASSSGALPDKPRKKPGGRAASS